MTGSVCRVVGRVGEPPRTKRARGPSRAVGRVYAADAVIGPVETQAGELVPRVRRGVDSP